MATILLVMVIGFIGSAPGSTGSGIKISTLSVFLATIRAAINGTFPTVNIKSRRLVKDQVGKAIAIVSLSVLWILGATFCILITQKGISLFALLFEVVSAFTNLGLTMGITTQLTMSSKFIIMLSMIIGRIGSLTLILALRKLSLRGRESVEFSYPEERIMLS